LPAGENPTADADVLKARAADPPETPAVKSGLVGTLPEQRSQFVPCFVKR
jgi:hypothetical protein